MYQGFLLLKHFKDHHIYYGEFSPHNIFISSSFSLIVSDFQISIIKDSNDQDFSEK